VLYDNPGFKDLCIYVSTEVKEPGEKLNHGMFINPTRFAYPHVQGRPLSNQDEWLYIVC